MAHAVTAASLATGASPSAGPASAMGMLRIATLGQAAACAAVTTQTVKGARGRWDTCPDWGRVLPAVPAPADLLPAGARLDTLGTQRWAPGSTAGPAPVLRGPAPPATSLPPATKTAAPNRSSATAALGTQVGTATAHSVPSGVPCLRALPSTLCQQVPAVMSVPLGTMGILCRVGAACPASATITSM